MLGQILAQWTRKLTSNAGEKLARERLNLTARKGNKSVALQEIKHTLAQKIRDDADVVSEVEAIAEVDALVAVGLVIGSQG